MRIRVAGLPNYGLQSGFRIAATAARIFLTTKHTYDTTNDVAGIKKI